MLFVQNDDRPGMVGAIGTLLGAAGVNIANMNVSRNRPGGQALSAIQVDGDVPAAALDDARGDARHRAAARRHARRRLTAARRRRRAASRIRNRQRGEGSWPRAAKWPFPLLGWPGAKWPRGPRSSGRAGSGEVAARSAAKWPRGLRPSGRAGSGEVAARSAAKWPHSSPLSGRALRPKWPRCGRVVARCGQVAVRVRPVAARHAARRASSRPRRRPADPGATARRPSLPCSARGDEEDPGCTKPRRSGSTASSSTGTRPGPRAHPRAALRLGRLRGHPRVRDRSRHRRLPADATTCGGCFARRRSTSCDCRTRRRSSRRRCTRPSRANELRVLLRAPDRRSAATARWA